MQNWDRSRQDIKFKQKLNSVKSTLPKIANSSGSNPSLFMKKSPTQQMNQNLNNLENLYINTNYKKKIGSSPPSSAPTSSASPKAIKGVNTKYKNNDMKHQNYLKHLLNEFGLSQYLRKLFELGYDDNNINKIGLMNRKAFQDLLANLKMFPGQSIKMEKLYNYLKQLNLANTMYNTRLIGGRLCQVKNLPKKPNTSEQSRKRSNVASTNNMKLNNNNMNNYNNNNYNGSYRMERPNTTNSITKVKAMIKMNNLISGNNTHRGSSNTIDHNVLAALSPNKNKNEYNCLNKIVTKNNNNGNMLLNSFKQGDLGYEFYLNNNNYNKKEVEKNPVPLDNNKKFNKFENVNNFQMNEPLSYNEGELIEEKMTEDIDNMLKYYMEQLNEKLDDSYGSIHDSSLSHNISLPFNEPVPNNNNNKLINKKNNEVKNNINHGKIKLPTIKDNKEQKHNDIQIKDKNVQKNTKNFEKNEGGDKISTKNLPKNEKKEEKREGKIDEKKNLSHEKNNGSLTNDNINKAAERKNFTLEEEDVISENVVNDIKKTKDDTTDENKDLDKNKINTNTIIQKVAKLNEPLEKTDEIDEKIEIVEENKKQEEPEIKYDFKGEKIESNEEIKPQENNPNERYSLEENIYDNLRLTKSLGGDYLHQNIEKFDIEYMCRCLSLAIMKILESGKGKHHITDLMAKDNEKFQFFNNLFNSNSEIITEFFKNKENDNNQNKEIISNLEKLELKLNNDMIEDNNDINILKHLKKDTDNKLIKEQEIKDKQFKLKNNLADIEKDIKFIDEFFSIGRKRIKNYQNISEKSKNILCKELSYINEVDSEMTNRTNSMISANNDKTNNNNSKFSAIQKDNEVIKEKEDEENYENDFDRQDIIDEKKEEEIKEDDNLINNKFSSTGNPEETKKEDNEINQNLKIDEEIKNNNEIIKEELPPNKINKEMFESGSMESDYIIDANTMVKFKSYLLKQAEVFDDDFIYSAMHIPTRKYVPPPDPQVVFEFCANIMILTKMEKEVIIITLLYLERFIFNTGLLLTSRNWRRIIFITMAIASKIWDDDSFENNHFAQVFKHLSIGEINLLERTFLDMINYKVFVKCSEYFKYFFIIKSIALKYNYNGAEMIPISVERMMKIQEYAYQMQKRVKKKVNLSNSTKF